MTGGERTPPFICCAQQKPLTSLPHCIFFPYYHSLCKLRFIYIYFLPTHFLNYDITRKCTLEQFDNNLPFPSTAYSWSNIDQSSNMQADQGFAVYAWYRITGIKVVFSQVTLYGHLQENGSLKYRGEVVVKK